MASSYRSVCSSCLTRPSIAAAAFSSPRTALRNESPSTALAPFLLALPPFTAQTRNISANAAKYRRKTQATTTRKKKTRTHYETPDLKNALQFSLVDAMRYLRAAEVGQLPTSAKYEVHVKLRTPKNGAVVRNRLRLPHPVATDLRICVIAPSDSAHGRAAAAAGAALVGEEHVFDMVKEGRIDFDRCICHQDSLAKLSKSGVARILGPRGLMPSAKTGTVVKDVAASVKDMVGASEYRERVGVVSMAIGQLGFTPEEMQRNIRSFVESVKRDIAGLSDRISKGIHEIVLSSTHGPGLSLNGELRTSQVHGSGSVPNKDLSTA